MKRHFRDNGWAVRVPRRYKDLRQRVNRCRDDLVQRLRRPPGVADFAPTSTPTTTRWRGRWRPSTRTRPAPWPTPATTTARPCWTGAARANPGTTWWNCTRCRIRRWPACPAGTGGVITLRFFGDLTQSEIAAEVGLSQMHVSRLIARTLRRLHRALRDSYPGAA